MSVVTFNIGQYKPHRSKDSNCSFVGSKAYPTSNMRKKAKIVWRDDTEEANDQSQTHVRIKSFVELQATPTPRICLPYMTSTMFACALEDCVTQMRILSECNNELRIMKTMSDMALHLALKFQVEQPTNEDELAKIDPKQLGCNQYKLDKLFNDRKYITDVLEQTYMDMAFNRCFTSLKDINNDIIRTDEYRLQLVDEEARNRVGRRETMRQLRQQRNYFKTVLYDTNATIDQLKCQVEDTELNSQIRSRYAENWQRARTEQHDQTILDKESGPSDNINYYRSRADQEQRIHAEVELLVNIFINDILTKVDTWMTKYDADMEAQDLKIAIMKNKYQDAMAKRKNLEETYATHEQLMKDWIKFKEERAAAQAYTKKMTNSAIIVQAWWRGLLVRLALGPYKSKKKPKKAKPEDADKKKK